MTFVRKAQYCLVKTSSNKMKLFRKTWKLFWDLRRRARVWFLALHFIYVSKFLCWCYKEEAGLESFGSVNIFIFLKNVKCLNGWFTFLLLVVFVNYKALLSRVFLSLSMFSCLWTQSFFHANIRNQTTRTFIVIITYTHSSRSIGRNAR